MPTMTNMGIFESNCKRSIRDLKAYSSEWKNDNSVKFPYFSKFCCTFLLKVSKAADHLSDTSPYDPKCRWSNCFDIFNCTELTFYLYPLSTRTINGKVVTPKLTKEWHRIYKVWCQKRDLWRHESWLMRSKRRLMTSLCKKSDEWRHDA